MTLNELDTESINIRRQGWGGGRNGVTTLLRHRELRSPLDVTTLRLITARREGGNESTESTKKATRTLV